MRNYKGQQLTAAHAYPPLMLGRCQGGPDLAEKFLECAKGVGPCDGMEQDLGSFTNLQAHMEFLKLHGIRALGKRGETYWIGSLALLKFSQVHLNELLDLLESSGVAGVVVNQLRENPPSYFVPHHNWIVLLNGKKSGALDGNSLANVNGCCIRVGKVIRANSTEVELEVDTIQNDDGKLIITAEKTTVPLDQSIPTYLKPGDYVSIHWDWICWKLNLWQVFHLRFWTNKIIKNHKKL